MKKESVLIIPNHGIIVDNKVMLIEKAELDLIATLKDYNFQVGVSAIFQTIENSSLTGKIAPEEQTLHNIGIFANHNTKFKKLINHIYTVFKTPFIISKYDVVYAFYTGHSSLITCLWAFILNKPYGLYIRCSWLKNGKTPLLSKLLFRFAQFAIVTGTSFQNKLQQYPMTTLVEAPLTPFKPLENVPERTSDGSTTKIIFVGRIVESKGVLDIIRALPKVKTHIPNIKLVIAGGGTEAEISRLINLTKSLDVEANVELKGYLKKQSLEQLYLSSEAIVFPSYFAEGFPRVLYESMMYALPIVTCPMPGTEDFLIQNSNCEYCPPHNSELLSETILKLLRDSKKRNAMAFNNLKKVSDFLDSLEHDSHPEQLIYLLNERCFLSTRQTTEC